MDIIDSIHHYIFNIFECRLRVLNDGTSDDHDIDNDRGKRNVLTPNLQR